MTVADIGPTDSSFIRLSHWEMLMFPKILSKWVHPRPLRNVVCKAGIVSAEAVF